ncbi:expressed unknown protein [Seminavis robusta]|uniref:VWFA domain-containing protein n=1 Tax=Seminavis robusta TaxID=568900 RepID=A0A9N8DGF9_9STRA|nr:expressed unknown protein [Seminavis robusta]|eukprot:Sro113_g056000.1 n/a (587) ;mRNA; r:39714-41863
MKRRTSNDLATLGTQALTTSYDQGGQGTGTTETSRQQRHERQKQLAAAKAKAITQRYQPNVQEDRPLVVEGTEKQQEALRPVNAEDRARIALAKAQAITHQWSQDQVQEGHDSATLRTTTTQQPDQTRQVNLSRAETITSQWKQKESQQTTTAPHAALLQRQLPGCLAVATKQTPNKQPGPPLPTDKHMSTFPIARPIIARPTAASSPPRAPPNTWQAKLPEQQMDEEDLAYLQGEGYPLGLIKAMTDLKADFFQQIWIIDNSESMNTRDGSMLADVSSSNGSHGTSRRFVHGCSRWDELKECVVSHIRLSGALRQPTSFRLLNDPGSAAGPQQFGICESALSHGCIAEQVQHCRDIMERNYPVGQTPLTQHIRKITEEIQAVRSGLLASGKRISIVICTDGIPTDAPNRQFFVDALRKLETMPVWLVIRLCTDEPSVVDYYNQLDDELKLSIDVIDDFQGEALDVCKRNPWLNYGLPLHRARERGYHERVLDLLDECPLSTREQKEVCGIIFGKEKVQHCPEADVDKPRFLAHMDSLQREEQLQWDPIDEKVKTWVDFTGDTKGKLRKMGKNRRKKTSRFFRLFR